MKTSILQIFFLLCIISVISCQEKPFHPPKYEFSDLKMFYSSKTFHYFEKVKWKDSLSKDDKNLILETIDSSYNIVARDRVYDILIPSLIHRFNLSEERENLFFWKINRELFEKTENMNDNEFDEHLFSLIQPKHLVKNLKHTMTHYHYIGDDYLNVLVTRQSKRLRNELEVNIEIPDSLLNKRQEYLLKFSEFEENYAIEKLHNLAKTYDAKNNTYHGQISGTLSSYGRNATLKSYSIFMNKELLSEYSYFGKYMIVRHLSFKSLIDLNNKELLELKDRINSIQVEDEKLVIAPYIISLLKKQIEIEIELK